MPVVSKFPFLKLPTVVRKNVYCQCQGNDIIQLSLSSKTMKRLVTDSHVRPKLSVTTLRDEGKIEFNGFNWMFTLGGFVLREDTLLNELVNTVETQLDGRKVIWRTRCSDWKAVMTMVLRQLKVLLNIQELHVFEHYAFSDDLRTDTILQQVGICSIFRLTVNTNSCPNIYCLDWVLRQVSVRETISILNENRRNRTSIKYEAPLFGAVKHFKFVGLQCPSFMTILHLGNCTKLHFNSAGIPAHAFNNIFREWKQGNLPQLQMVENSGHIRFDNGQHYMNALREGLDCEPWDAARERTFNMRLFYVAAGAEWIYRSLDFRNGKDIGKDDGIKGTIIPSNVDIFEDEFLFVVWSSWLPRDHNFDNPEHNHEYQPRR